MPKRFRLSRLIGLVASEGFLLGLVLLTIGQPPSQADAAGQWSTPLNISSQMKDAWFPDITVDNQGVAHVVYLGSEFYSVTDPALMNKYDLDYYQAFSTEGKPLLDTPANIAISPFGWVARASMIADSKHGLLYMLFRNKTSLYFQAAPLDKAALARSWSEPRNLDDNSSSYYSDIVADSKGVIHAVWTQVVGNDITNLHQAIIYRSSQDRGVTWSFPRQLVEPKYATTRVSLKIDSTDGLHLSWDDGYDNQTARFTSILGGYMHSLDGGKSWSKPLILGSEDNPQVQTVATPFGTSSVMVVWRLIAAQQIQYIVSGDRGETWSAKATIPDITARNFTGSHQFDRYYLAADAKGRVHLAAVGQTVSLKKGDSEKEGELGVYHLVWDKDKWSKPDLVASGPGFVEYPRIGIGPNRLHFVWFSRDKPVDETSKAVWYSSQPYDTGVTVQPVVAYQPPQATVIPATTPPPAPTAQVILPPLEQSAPSVWMTEGYTGTVLALVPVLVLALIMFMSLWWLNRRSR